MAEVKRQANDANDRVVGEIAILRQQAKNMSDACRIPIRIKRLWYGFQAVLLSRAAPKIDFNINLNSNGLAVLHRRLKPPLLYREHGLLI